MSGAREIRSKISSVQNTRKVTRALEMVSASKIRKTEQRMAASRPYARMMQQVIGHIAYANPEYVHPFMVEREDIKRAGMIVISTDRGLCGGLNSNLYKQVLNRIAGFKEQGVEVDLVVLGRKGKAFFKRVKGVQIVGSAENLGDAPTLESLIGVITIMLSKYREGEIDSLDLAYNDFVNTMTQQPSVEPLLPLPPTEEEDADKLTGRHWDYIYEPGARDVLDQLLVRYVESLVYQGVLENVASENAARMIAMKNASDNATDLIDDLKLVYNKARQAAITQELSEIVSGAAAV